MFPRLPTWSEKPLPCQCEKLFGHTRSGCCLRGASQSVQSLARTAEGREALERAKLQLLTGLLTRRPDRTFMERSLWWFTGQREQIEMIDRAKRAVVFFDLLSGGGGS